MLLAPPPPGPVDYQVVKATHVSRIERSDADGYHGVSTSRWSLGRRSRFRMSWMAGGLYSGTGHVDVKGTYDVDVTTPAPGHCAFAAKTGDAAHPLVAPAPFDLSASPDPRRPGRAQVGFVAVHATLKNAYLGSECSRGVDEPEWARTETIDVAPAKLRARRVTLRFAGSEPGATWRTEIVLQRR
ncbi:MAG TPA: hypothetical protein VFG42_05580 [Baekduia sp.]|uniref:hypothetical protein n=1 Tax=Baekduia sp. TaxID=2600305 RepID=UPI002D7A06C7|nr:hypothetical protein [Baekduia sp.]HET6506238.1 hypothetical protein [Baekduia sp.]